jgi:hypothetical protein
MQEELIDLSALNGAMFNQLFATPALYRRFIATQYDVTDADKDKCEVERNWDLQIEGDFCIVKRLGRYLYLIVGDATGHNAYAGGLKLFVAAALETIFYRFDERRRAPACKAVLRELSKWFIDVGHKSLKDGSRLQDGVDAVILRFDLMRRRVSFASAGIPVLALRSEDSCLYGEFDNTRGIRFPDGVGVNTFVEPQTGTINVKKFPFLAVVTDGFRNLKRARRGSKCASHGSIMSFDDKAITNALLVGAKRVSGEKRGKSAAAAIASSLIDSARKFRRGFKVLEIHDDARLVVAVDVNRAFSASAERLNESGARGRPSWHS